MTMISPWSDWLSSSTISAQRELSCGKATGPEGPESPRCVVVLLTLQLGFVIIIEATLSFLGAGVPPPTPTWGQMVASGRIYIESAWWISLFPELAIALVVSPSTCWATGCAITSIQSCVDSSGRARARQVSSGRMPQWPKRTYPGRVRADDHNVACCTPPVQCRLLPQIADLIGRNAPADPPDLPLGKERGDLRTGGAARDREIMRHCS
jgi:hypothetical protein